MATPIGSNLTTLFAKAQSAVGTAATLGNSNAIRHVTVGRTVEGPKRTRRGNLRSAYTGGVRPVSTGHYITLAVTTEFLRPTTAGDLTTWNHQVLWEASPLVVTDAGTTITIGPAAGSIPLTHWVPITAATEDVAGNRYTVMDACAIPAKIYATAGERWMIDWVIMGKRIANAATSLTAPTFVGDGLPTVAMGGTYDDGYAGSIGTLPSFEIDVGVRATMPATVLATNGYGVPQVAIPEECVVKVMHEELAVGTFDYEGAMLAGTAATLALEAGGIAFASASASAFPIDCVRSSVEELQSVEMTYALVGTATGNDQFLFTLS